MEPCLFSHDILLCCRFMFKMKSYVRNKNRPEGSMAEGYIVEECLKFVSRYLDVSETREIHGARNQEESSRPLYGGTTVQLSMTS